MTKRSFLTIAGAGSCLWAVSLLLESSDWKVLFRKFKGRLKFQPETRVPPSRGIAQLPVNGEQTSVELALNSRCCSDYDGDPEVSHWGMLDPSVQLSSEQIGRIAEMAKGCRIAQDGTGIETEGNTLIFFVNKADSPEDRELQMIGSGMQQQSALLACAALGVGAVFNNLGLDGKEGPLEKQHVTTSIVLNPMKPSYRGSFWTSSFPERERSWVPGNLPDPRRNGATPLISVLEKISCEHPEGNEATRSDISQLLWAARGRTPHLRNSVPWGLTIPTWQGLQDVSSVYAAAGSKLYRYVNWWNGRPTHSLQPVTDGWMASEKLNALFSSWNSFIILATDDPHARGLWEIGYQLLNLCVQARALGTAYQAILLNDAHRKTLAGSSMERPAVVFALKAVDARTVES